MAKKFLVLLCILFLNIVGASANDWSGAFPRDFYSANKIYKVRVLPHDTFDYPERKEVVGKRALAKLYKKTGDGYELLRRFSLENRVAPTSMHVSDDGRYVLALGDWYTRNNTVSIFSGGGRLIKKLTLESLLFVESLNWYLINLKNVKWMLGAHVGTGKVYFEGNRLVLHAKVETNSKKLYQAWRRASWKTSVKNFPAYPCSRVTCKGPLKKPVCGKPRKVMCKGFTRYTRFQEIFFDGLNEKKIQIKLLKR